MIMDDRTRFNSTLQSNLEQLGLAIKVDRLDQMWHHFELLAEANRRINLTRITDPAQAAAKHYADSLAVTAWCKTTGWKPATVLDVGTGGGFPAVPLAVDCPHWQITAIDSTGKKVRCVESFVTRLALSNCKVLHKRAEEWCEKVPKFDLILFRAMGPIGECLTLAGRFCNRHSIVMCYKSDPLPTGEDRDAKQMAARKGFAKLTHWPYRLTCREETISHQLCCYRYE